MLPFQQIGSTHNILMAGSMQKPGDGVRYPIDQHFTNQFNQLKVANTPVRTITVNNPTLVSQPGTPQAVSGIRTITSPIAGSSNVKVTVSFTRNPADKLFQKANVYLTSGNGVPNIVGVTSGTSLSFTTAKGNPPYNLHVQSSGTTADLPLTRSPSRVFTL